MVIPPLKGFLWDSYEIPMGFLWDSLQWRHFVKSVCSDIGDHCLSWANKPCFEHSIYIYHSSMHTSYPHPHPIFDYQCGTYPWYCNSADGEIWAYSDILRYYFTNESINWSKTIKRVVSPTRYHYPNFIKAWIYCWVYHILVTEGSHGQHAFPQSNGALTRKI